MLIDCAVCFREGSHLLQGKIIFHIRVQEEIAGGGFLFQTIPL